MNAQTARMLQLIGIVWRVTYWEVLLLMHDPARPITLDTDTPMLDILRPDGYGQCMPFTVPAQRTENLIRWTTPDANEPGFLMTEPISVNNGEAFVTFYWTEEDGIGFDCPGYAPGHTGHIPEFGRLHSLAEFSLRAVRPAALIA